jgi:hypothetical protein
MNRLVLTVGTVSLVVWGIGCGSTKMTPTGPDVEAREANCEFRMFTTAPEGYAEVAAIDVKPGAYGHNVFTELGDFKEEIRPAVCQAGGDAAIAYANGYGMYIKATVLKRLATSARASTPVDGAQPDVPASAATKAPAEAGCHYDTQCKGDRVCVKGECVDASPAAASPSASAPAP